MSAPTLTDAVLALNRRKEAAGMAFGDARLGSEVNAILAGTDVSAEELDRVLGHVANGLAMLLTKHGAADNLPGALASAWADGLLTGILFADLREKAEAER